MNILALAIKARRELSLDIDAGENWYIQTLCGRENGRQKGGIGGNTRISAKPATKLEYTRHVVNMFKHDNNHNVSIIPEDEAPYRPLQVYEAAFIAHCNIITSGTGINMINRIDQVRRNFNLYHMRFSLGREIKTDE